MTTETHSTTDRATKWAETFERLRAAEAASNEYCRATDPLYALEWALRARVGIDDQRNQPDFLDRLNALRAEHPAYFVPDFMNAHRDKLVDDVVRIEGELMAMPAPDHMALRWKLDKTGGDAWEPEYLAQMYRDMDRLLGPSTYAGASCEAAA